MGTGNSGWAVREGLSEVTSEQNRECGCLGQTWKPRSLPVAARPAPSLAPADTLVLAPGGLRLCLLILRQRQAQHRVWRARRCSVC